MQWINCWANHNWIDKKKKKFENCQIELSEMNEWKRKNIFFEMFTYLLGSANFERNLQWDLLSKQTFISKQKFEAGWMSLMDKESCHSRLGFFCCQRLLLINLAGESLFRTNIQVNFFYTDTLLPQGAGWKLIQFKWAAFIREHGNQFTDMTTKMNNNMPGLPTWIFLKRFYLAEVDLIISFQRCIEYDAQ